MGGLPDLREWQLDAEIHAIGTAGLQRCQACYDERMHAQLLRLQEITELDQLVADSWKQPVLLFKHSRTCGISAEALEELISHLDAAETGARYAMVTVQTHRDVSNEVATRLGIRHHTPQVILVRDGRAVWSASHFRVNALTLNRALTSP